jgi:hypothetical protein
MPVRDDLSCLWIETLKMNMALDDVRWLCSGFVRYPPKVTADDIAGLADFVWSRTPMAYIRWFQDIGLGGGLVSNDGHRWDVRTVHKFMWSASI